MKAAIVLGSAASVFDDYAGAIQIVVPEMVFAVNHIGRDFPGRVDAFCSTHSENLAGWLEERREMGHPDIKQVWMNNTRKIPPELQRYDVRRTDNLGGSSGHLGIMAARANGYEKIIVAGMPIDHSAHYNDPRPWWQYEIFQQTWTRDQAFLKRYVRSMSGWSRDLLGAPTKEWLSEPA